MIASFRGKETEELWRSGKSRRFPADLRIRAFKKLAILNAAIAPDNLRVPPENQLEALSGDRAGNTAFESTTNTGSALFGGMGMHLTLKSWITTRVEESWRNRRKRSRCIREKS